MADQKLTDLGSAGTLAASDLLYIVQQSGTADRKITLSAFQAGLTGVAGGSGAGPAGATGKTGSTGATGVGVAGATGATGPAGATGSGGGSGGGFPHSNVAGETLFLATGVSGATAPQAAVLVDAIGNVGIIGWSVAGPPGGAFVIDDNGAPEIAGIGGTYRFDNSGRPLVEGGGGQNGARFGFDRFGYPKFYGATASFEIGLTTPNLTATGTADFSGATVVGLKGFPTLNASTTDATVTYLTSHSSLTGIPMVPKTIMAVSVQLCAVDIDTGYTGAWLLSAQIKCNAGGTVALVGSGSRATLGNLDGVFGGLGVQPSFYEDNTNQGWTIQVMGVVATNIKWSANVVGSEINW